MGVGSVLILDDRSASLRQIRELGESVQLEIHVCACAADLFERVHTARPTNDDAGTCAVVGLRLTEMSGLEVLRHATKSAHPIPVILRADVVDARTAVQAMKEGAFDFLVEPLSDEMILQCLREALRKDAQSRRRQRRRDTMAKRLEHLTPRERQVMGLVVAGKPSKQIARLLYLSQKTVEAHRAHIMRKMGVDGVVELVSTVTLSGYGQLENGQADEGIPSLP